MRPLFGEAGTTGGHPVSSHQGITPGDRDRRKSSQGSYSLQSANFLYCSLAGGAF